MEQTLLAISEANTRQTSLVRPSVGDGGGVLMPCMAVVV